MDSPGLFLKFRFSGSLRETGKTGMGTGNRNRNNRNENGTQNGIKPE